MSFFTKNLSYSKQAMLPPLLGNIKDFFVKKPMRGYF
jgi:hypothetical protein